MIFKKTQETIYHALQRLQSETSLNKPRNDKKEYTGSAKKTYTDFNERKLCCIIDYCKSTIYFRQHNNMIYVFTST